MMSEPLKSECIRLATLSIHTAVPAFAPGPSSSEMTTPGPPSTPASDPSDVRNTRAFGLSRTTVAAGIAINAAASEKRRMVQPPISGRVMLHRVRSTGHGVPTAGIDRLEDLARGARLRQLRRDRLGPGVFRDGRERRAGARFDGPRGGLGNQLFRHRERVRR